MAPLNPPEELVLVCSCSGLDHVVRFASWEDGECFVDVSMGRPDSLFRRLRSAWRFVTNKTCRFVTASEVILSPEDIPKLRAWLDRAEKTIKAPEAPNANAP